MDRGRPGLGAALAAGGPWVALALVRARRRRWREAVRRGAPLAARAIADALAGGHSLRGAVSAAAAEGGVPGPAGRELAACARAVALGAPTEDALEGLRVRAGGGPWDTLVAAMLLQRDAGGDLAGLLRDTAVALEDADRLERDARAVTAQARFTGLLVSGLPLAAAALAELARPGYLGGLVRSPLTLWLGGCAAGFQLAALMLIHRLARPRP